MANAQCPMPDTRCLTPNGRPMIGHQASAIRHFFRAHAQCGGPMPHALLRKPAQYWTPESYWSDPTGVFQPSRSWYQRATFTRLNSLLAAIFWTIVWGDVPDWSSPTK